MRTADAFDRLRAQLLEPLDELGRLLARARHDDALAEQRPLVEPAQVLAQPRDLADDDDRGGAQRIRRASRFESSSSVPCIVR